MSDQTPPVPESEVSFSAATALAAEGARVGFVTCSECGASILLDPRDKDDMPERHRKWHRRLEHATTVRRYA